MITAFFPHQNKALDLALKRLETHRAVYLALDPGLGKTPLSTFMSDFFGTCHYISPPGLVSNVIAESKTWAFDPITVIADNKIPDTSPKIDLLIVDETHRFKNENAQRTKAFLNYSKNARKIIFLSGTPMPNSRPVELWTIVSNFAPEVFGTRFFPYGKKFCGAYKNDFGKWNFDGYTNQKEFKARLFKSFMIRMKKDVLKLPEKREGLLFVGDGIPAIVSKLEKKLLSKYSENDLVDGKIDSEDKQHVSTYLKAIGNYKLKYFYPILEHLLYETDEKIILFAHHKTVIDELVKFLHQFKPIVLTGSTPSKKRQALIDTFQTDKKRRVAVMNIIAGGIGWNMTEADRIIFFETSWRHGDNVQAGDRGHRATSTKPLLIQYIVLKDSFDAKRMSIILEKGRKAI